MGLIGKYEKRARVTAGVSVATDSWLTESLGTPASASGIEVTPRTALSSTTILSLLQRKSKDVGQLPLHLYRRQSSGGRKRDLYTGDARYRMLRLQPNPEQTAFVWRRQMQTDLDVYGNALAEIQRDGFGAPVALWWLPAEPGRWRMVRKNGALWYLYTVGGREVPFEGRRDIIHLRGWGMQNGRGESLISLACDAIGLSKAAEIQASKHFVNGMSVSGIIEHPDRLEAPGRERLRKKYEATYGGLSNTERLMIIDEGMKWKERGVNPQAAQMLESRQFSVTDIARVWNMPVHLVGDLSNAHHRNIEQQNLEYVIYCLSPDLVLWEQELAVKLFEQSEQEEMFVEFLLDMLLRGDTETRFKMYEVLQRCGAITQDEIRDRENMNRLPGGVGSHVFMPVNMMPIEAMLSGLGSGASSGDEDVDGDDETRGLKKENFTTEDTENTESLPVMLAGLMLRNEGGLERAVGEARDLIAVREKGLAAKARARLALRRAWMGKVREAAQRVIEMEVAGVLEVAKKHLTTEYTENTEGRAIAREEIEASRGLDTFWAGIQEFYSGVPAAVRATMGPVMIDFMEAIGAAAADEVGGAPADMGGWIEGWIKSYSRRHAGESVKDLEKIFQGAGGVGQGGAEAVLKEIEARMTTWQSTAAEALANRAVTQSDGAVAREVWRRSGVRKLTWVGGTCPFCKQLSGRTVGIEQSFVSQGEKLESEGKTPIWAGANVLHPPLHSGCACSIVAG